MSKHPTSEHYHNAIKHDRDRFVAFAFASSDMLIELNQEQEIGYIDGATRGFLGEEAAHFLHKPFSHFLAQDQLTVWAEISDEIIQFGRAQQRKLMLQSRLFDKLPVAVSGVILPNDASRIYLSFSILREEMDEAEFSSRDFATGLLNKEAYAKRAAERLNILTAEGKTPQISLIDLPDLKKFLDEMEPERSKELMREVADYLRSQSVDNDTAGMVDSTKFSLLHDSDVVGHEVASEVQALLSKLNPAAKQIETRVSTIDGHVKGLNNEDSARAVLFTLNKFADRNENFSFENLQDSYDSLLNDTVSRITQFKSTVEENSFELAYQPIVDLRNGIVHHFEALVRLKEGYEANQFSNPFEFINFGEQTGLINEFDLAMCRRALVALDREHEKAHWPSVAINMSGRSLSSQIFMDAMLAMMNGFPHIRKQVMLEVTESAKISDMETANNFLQELRKRGHIVCLDDFGVAESSFDYLRYLHVDHIKIDGSYVRENLNTTRGRHLLRAMVGMCRNLGMTTIAEMVEDDKTAGILWESGVHYGQGWLFGKPDTSPTALELWNKPCPTFKGMMNARKQADSGADWFDKK